jgi:hypothetical protein
MATKATVMGTGLFTIVRDIASTLSLNRISRLPCASCLLKSRSAQPIRIEGAEICEGYRGADAAEHRKQATRWSALEAYSRWGFDPGTVTVSQLKIPIEFANRPKAQTSKRTLPQPAILYPLLIVVGLALMMAILKRRKT